MIQFRRGSTKAWKDKKTPTLAAGQPGYDKEKHIIKVGDGKSSWEELPSASGLDAKEILYSEADAKKEKLDTLFTYGEAAPNKNTIGQVYLQHYESEPEADYVISSGVNKGWTYQKWKSGIARCWGTFELTTNIQSSLDNGLYQSSSNLSEITYPFSFIDVPSESASLQSPGTLVWLSAVKKMNTEKHSAIYSVISPDKAVNTAVYKITLQIEGFWR